MYLLKKLMPQGGANRLLNPLQIPLNTLDDLFRSGSSRFLWGDMEYYFLPPFSCIFGYLSTFLG
jgi:hypothetical protein